MAGDCNVAGKLSADYADLRRFFSCFYAGEKNQSAEIYVICGQKPNARACLVYAGAVWLTAITIVRLAETNTVETEAGDAPRRS